MVKFFEFLTLRELENSEASPGQEHRGWLRKSPCTALVWWHLLRP